MSENKLQRYSGNVVAPEALEDAIAQFKGIADFQKLINSSPNALGLKVETNKLANNSLYIPIGELERGLDQIYSGLWNLYVDDVRIVVNEILYTVTLEVFHPIAKTWLRRVGTGAVQIRMRKDSDITDINSKIKNALQADAPHALSEAVKNAAKKFGLVFGRGLNRDDDYSKYKGFDEFVNESDLVLRDILVELDNCKTKADVKAAFERLKPELKANLIIKQKFIDRGKELVS